MLVRIKEAIALANSPGSDPVTKKQAIEYLTQIKSDPNAAELFASLLNDPGADSLTKFVALQALSDIIAQGTPQDPLKTALFIKDAMIGLLRNKITNNIDDPDYVKNKISELLTRLFLAMYSDINGNQWNTFFSDLISLLQINSLMNSTDPALYNSLGLDYFLRICIFINSEIADQTFVRSKDIQIRNNHLKDQMRLSDIQIIVNIWLNTLKSILPSALPQQQQQQQQQSAKSQFTEIATLALSCIGSYISWIDISLIINPDYINVIYNYLDFQQTKIACSQCLCEIIAKKMKPMEKLTLLSMLNLTEKVTTLNDTDDIEIYEQLAKLSSSVGLELAIILEQCNETPDVDTNLEIQQVAMEADQRIINQVAPLLLKFMSNEYDSVTQQCFAFVSQYLSVLKKLFAIGGKPGSAVTLNSKKQPLDQDHSNFLISLLNVIFKKLKIDETSDEDSEDEIEEFNETIRSKLKTFQDSICVINPTLYLENISSHIQSLLPSSNWRDMELALYQMHNLCETIRNNLFGLNKQDISNSTPSLTAVKFMSILLQNSSIFQMDSPYVQILFFELIVRHHAILNAEKEEFALLKTFCSEFGMFNKREKVRLRTWYLFTRFVKTTKPRYPINVLSEIISKMNLLLSIKVTSVNADGTEDDTTFDNQMYLFEGIGLLLGANSDSNYDILDEVLTPMFTDLESCISSQVQTPEVVLQCHHILMAIGTLARGVHGGLVPENQVNNTLVSKRLINRSLVEKFSNIAEVVLVTFSYFHKHENIRDASRFTFSRLIPILNNEIIPFAHKLIALFLESELKMLEMNDFLGFLGQMIHTFRKDESCLQVFTNLLTPVVNKVHEVLNMINNEYKLESQNSDHEIKGQHPKNIIVTDSFRDKILLKKGYFAFLQSYITNSVTSLLLVENNANTLSIILTDLLTYTPEEIQETSAMKLSLNVLANFVKYFGSGKCTDPNDPHVSTAQRVEGLNEFFISKVIPLVFEIPFNPEYKFNVKEGGCRVIACDLSRLLIELYVQSGGGADVISNPCLKYLSEIYLPQIQFPPALIMEFMEMLVTSDQKAFEKYYVSLIDKLMS